VVCDGAGDNACLPSLQQVGVTVSGPTAEIAALEAADLTPVVDVSGLAPGTHTVPVEIALPDGITLVAIAPGALQVTITAPVTPTPVPTTAP
jgi:YbbR domain-containing protein